MKRRIFTILWALSPLPCIGMLLLWARSHWIMDSYSYCSGQPAVMRQEGPYRVGYPRIWSICSASGRLGMGYRVDRSQPRSYWSSGPLAAWRDPFMVRPANGFHMLGFEYGVQVGAPMTSSYAGSNGQGDIVVCRYWAVPYWFMVAVAGAMPLRWLLRARSPIHNGPSGPATNGLTAQ